MSEPLEALEGWQAEAVAMLEAAYVPDEQAELWRRDPEAWARDRLGITLWSRQADIVASVVAHRRTAVQSAHGLGKSFVAGLLACWWIDTHPVGDAIVVSTAPTAKQVSAILWEEIRKQHARGRLPGRITLTDEWRIDDVLVGMGRKPADHDQHGFQGIHRRYVLVILDEACGVPASLWAAVEAITTNAECRVLAIGNPDDPRTVFGDVCEPGSGWNVLHLSALDSPNLTGEAIPDGLAELLPSPEWVEDARARWGESSPLYRSKVLGEFPEASVDALIPWDMIRAAQARTLPPAAPTVLGVDVARYGSDSTVIYLRQGPVVRLSARIASGSTTDTAGRVAALVRITGAAAHVDGVGVGGGVVDMLQAAGIDAHDMQAGASPADSQRFVNARAEWFWRLRQVFESGQIDLDPADEQLAAELASLRFMFDPRGRIRIESKDDMRARGLSSPDRADALMLAFATHPTKPGMGSRIWGF